MSKIEDKFITYQLALKLKELGFNEPCLAYYTEFNGERKLSFNVDYKEVYSIGSYIKTDELGFLPIQLLNSHFAPSYPTAPTWSEAFEWLEDNISLIKHLVIRKNDKEDSFWWSLKLNVPENVKIKGYSNFSKSRYQAKVDILTQAIQCIESASK